MLKRAVHRAFVGDRQQAGALGLVKGAVKPDQCVDVRLALTGRTLNWWFCI